MASVNTRPARLDDAQAITQLHCATISVWQRLDAHGNVEEPPYEALTIYERWLHGGPWMSIETGVIFLNHLLDGAGCVIVAEQDGVLVGYLEAYPGQEPDPFGKHLHIVALVTQEASGAKIKDALIQAAIAFAQTQHYERLTVSFPTYDADSTLFYQGHNFEGLVRLNNYTISAQTGQSFYRAVPHPNADRNQIDGWHMSIGRTESARQTWETVWPSLWNAIPEITARKTHRMHFNASGQEAFVCVQQQLYTPRSATVYSWSPKPLRAQMLTAIRDWAHREGYRSLTLSATETTARIFGTEVEMHPNPLEVYAYMLD